MAQKPGIIDARLKEDPMRILRYSLVILAFCHTSQAWAKSASDFFPVCTAPGRATGKTLTVDPSGRTGGLEAALKSAKPGDTINLMSGDYGELNVFHDELL